MLAWLKRDKIDHPLATDKEARKIIGAFSYRDPCKTLEEANQWLKSINETAGFKLQRRFELIDLLDEATRKSQERLIDSYITLPEDDPQGKRYWQAACDFWRLLGDAYLACARQSSDTQRLPAEMKPQLPLLATRGLRALRHQLKWVLLRYGALRTEMWGECGRFAMLAESVDGALAEIEIFKGSNIQSSPAHELLRLMVFWVATPSGLSPVEQDMAERLVVYFTPKLHWSARQAPNHDYFFDLDGARPPLRLVPSAPVSAATRFVEISEARDSLRAMYSIVSSTSVLPVGPNWGPVAEPNVVIRVLRHLWTNWAKELPPRAAARQKTEESLNSVQGFQNVLGLVAPEGAAGLAAASALLSDAWIAEDISAGGFGVVVPQGRGAGLRVGMLVAMRTEAQSTWSVGVIRRISEHNYRQHHLGIQVVSRAAQPVYLRTLTGAKQGRKRESGVLLTEHPAPGGNVNLVIRRDLFSGREPVEALFGSDETPVMLEAGGVVESGHDFDWLQFKYPGAAQ